jgi:nuclear receptor subfamily 1 group D protein 3
VSSSDTEQSDAETKQLAVYDVILTVSQAFHANCGYTEDQTRGLVRKPLQAQPVCTLYPVVILLLLSLPQAGAI